MSFKLKAGRIYRCPDCEQVVRLSHVTRARCPVVRARARRQAAAYALAVLAILVFGGLHP
jgi:uncharacterized paraquat-inducible protein A